MSCAIFHSEQSNPCLQPSNCWLHATSASPGRWPSDRFLLLDPQSHDFVGLVLGTYPPGSALPVSTFNCVLLTVA